MPINDKKPLTDQIPHGQHLTLVDTLRAKFLPLEEQEAFLRRKAQERKAESENKARAGEG